MDNNEIEKSNAMNASDTETAHPRWKGLYKIGGAAALFAVAIIPIQLAVFIVRGQPESALGWFTLFQSNEPAGLLAFEFLFVINGVLGIATTLALYVVLRQTNESLLAIALVLGLIEAMAFIVARPALEMLYLSNQYAAATTDVLRATLLAAGEAMLATFKGTAFHVGNNFFSIYFLIAPIAMLQSNIFGRVTAYVGILAAILNWGLYVPEIALLLSALSVLPLAIWNILIARRLFQLGRAS